MSFRNLRSLAVCALAFGCSNTAVQTDASVARDASVTRDALEDVTRPANVPEAPAADDPAFQVTARSWLMAGDGLTPRDREFSVSITAPDTVRAIDVWIDDAIGPRLVRGPDGTFHASVPAPPIGDHRLLLSADGNATAFSSRAVHVSAALYAVVSVDWDDANPPQVNLTRMETLRAHHPRLLYSQFVGPYVFTDPATPDARRQELVTWLTHQRDLGDEMGVHIHPRCTFVSTTSVPCRITPSTVNPMGDPTGYTVIFASYTLDEQTALLRAGADLMMSHGFARPTSFRAGAWTTQLSTLDACDRAGYTVESSAFPPETIQSAWAGTELARWNLMNWTGITPTSQPYHPSRTHLISSDPPPNFTALEVPDNGTLVDYMPGAAMVAVLRQNFPEGAPLATPRVFQVGLHPGSYSTGYGARLEIALTEVDQHLYASDTGPVVYARLTELTRVWP